MVLVASNLKLNVFQTLERDLELSCLYIAKTFLNTNRPFLINLIFLTCQNVLATDILFVINMNFVSPSLVHVVQNFS